MEESNGGTAISGPGKEPNDWRAKLTTDLRRTIVQKILGFLGIPPDASSHMIKIVENFEENAFRNARSKEEYKLTISRRLKLIDDKSSNQSAGVSSPKLGLNQNPMVAGGGQSSNLKNVYQAPSKFAGDSAGQGWQSNISAHYTQPSQNMVNQQHHHQQSEKKFLKHNDGQPNVGAFHIEDIRSGHHHQQQQHIVSQPNPLQFAQNQTLPSESRQLLFTEQSSTAVFQPNQLVTQRDNIGQQLSPFWETKPNTFQSPDGSQRNSSCLLPQHRVMTMKSHEHSAHILQLENASLRPKVGQLVQSVSNFHQLLDYTKQSKKEATHQRPETLASTVMPQIVNNQQMVLPSQKTIAEVSSALSPVSSLASATPSELANMAGLHDQKYQKLLSMKKEYLPWLTYLYNKLREKYREPHIPEIHKKKITAAERLIKYLSMSQGDLGRCSMKNLESYQQAVKLFFNSCKLENPVSAQHNAQLQPPGGQSQMLQLQHHSNGEQNLHPVNLALTSKPVGPSPLSPTQQVVLNSQPNKTNSAHSHSLMELKRQNVPSSLQHASRPEGHDIAGTQQIKSFRDTTGRPFDSTKKLQPQNTVINAFPQQRQLKHQMMQPQNGRQHMQPQWSQSQSQSQNQKKTQHMQMANVQPVTTSGMLQQDPLVSQLSDCSHRMPLPATPHHFHATSQMSQHSSNQKNLSLSKVGTPLFSANSPSIPADYEKHPSDAFPLLIPENLGPPKFLPVARPGMSESILSTESSSPDDNQQSSVTKEPFERLLKTVQSLSPKALSASVSEIDSALKMVDAIAGTACNDSRDIHENLESEARCCIHGSNFSLHCRCSFAVKMKRKTNAIALDETDILKQSTSQIWDIDSSDTSRIKRRRIEPSTSLLDEIKCINQQLLETVLYLDSTEDPAPLDAGEGTIVRCVYSAVALDENLKMQFASQMLPLPLRLFIPANYPNASPVILSGLSFDGSGESKESIDLLEKTRSRFSLSLRKLPARMSLAEMAMTWDNCARAVLLECAQSVGGGCFSSKYGKWENCVAA